MKKKPSRNNGRMWRYTPTYGATSELNIDVSGAPLWNFLRRTNNGERSDLMMESCYKRWAKNKKKRAVA